MAVAPVVSAGPDLVPVHRLSATTPTWARAGQRGHQHDLNRNRTWAGHAAAPGGAQRSRVQGILSGGLLLLGQDLLAGEPFEFSDELALAPDRGDPVVPVGASSRWTSSPSRTGSGRGGAPRMRSLRSTSTGTRGYRCRPASAMCCCPRGALDRGILGSGHLDRAEVRAMGS